MELNPDDFYPDDVAMARFEAAIGMILRVKKDRNPQLRSPCIEKLKEEIIHPERDTHLIPLMMNFKGHHNIRRWRQLWNYANAMFLAECQTLSEGTKMYRESAVGHLCGMHAAAIEHLRLQSFFSRLVASPKVCGIVPGLHEYARHVVPYAFNMVRTGVGLGSMQKRRRDVLRKLDKEFGKSGDRMYPYHRDSLAMEDQLLGAIHAAVPAGINRAIRADLCQDMAVAVLAGDIKIENLHDAMTRYLADAKKFTPHTSEEFQRYTGFLSQKRSDAVVSWQQQMASEEYKPTVEDLAEHFNCGGHLHAEPPKRDISVPTPAAKLVSLGGATQRQMQRQRTAIKQPSYTGGPMAEKVDELKAIYPIRRGGHGWGAVPRLIEAALASGASWDEMVAGAKNYAKHCQMSGKAGGEFVLQAKTFFGRDQHWQEWATMDLRTPTEIAAEAEWSALTKRAQALGFNEVDRARGLHVARTVIEAEERKRDGQIARELRLVRT